MKKTITILLLLLSIFISLKSQKMNETNNEAGVKNAIILSYGGSGIYFSLMYEHQLIQTDNMQIGAKAGVGTSFSSVLFPFEFNVPVGVTFLYGKNNSHIDFSMCFTNYLMEQYNYEKEKRHHELKFLITPSVGYRFQKKQGGIMFKAGISPIINFNKTTNVIIPWLDVGVGWGF